jgi:D-inositol-3-phosphate glycosyltransferase
VLVPSHSETYGLIALEAAASGVPVVATPTGGLRESVTERTGILISSRDPEEWARSLSTLIADPDAADRLSRSARDFALTRSWLRAAEETVAVYRAAIGDLETETHL